MKLPVSIKTNNVVQTKAFPQSAIKSPPMLGKSQLAKEILVLGIKVYFFKSAKKISASV
jgi:hypothetical protein